MRARLRLQITGRVQGVGFRPWLYRLAREHQLGGSISNSDIGVLAELEGEREQLLELRRVLPSRLPPHAMIDGLVETWLEPQGAEELSILPSADAGGRGARIPADLATCELCQRELRDPADRRAGYPFINCTACGPRYTIAEAIPYDRQRTSMRVFPLCASCAREYADPLDRRYHAEPTACPVCGPRLRLCDAAGQLLDEDALGGAVRRLRAGQVLAVKGLGGFHLAVDARQGAAVEELRRRKGRELKPLAVMVRDLEEARRHVELGPLEEELLTSPAAPIMVARRRPDSDLCEAVAPGNPYLGLMLPYTPLHHLLLAELPALVMTSGNLSEEPIAIDNLEARRRLARLADAFLEHDRGILVACDDSVVASSSRGPLLIRRSRGYVPDPIRLSFDAGQVLATGAQLKNTFCLTLGREAYLGPHVGDLDNLESYQQFQRALAHMTALLRLRPQAVVHDQHPDYLTTRFAAESGLPALAVQHHHAHVAAAAADHGASGPLLGLALDGTGFGSDGSIWGGELLWLPDLRRFERVGHLRSYALPGGEACIRAPRRTALALALLWLGPEAGGRAAALCRISDEEGAAVAALLRSGVGSPATTSCGRLFDGVAALCGLGGRVTFEGQPAMELEFLAAASSGSEVAYHMDVREAPEGGGLMLDPAPALAAILDDLGAGRPPPMVAAGFHAGLCAGLAELAGQAAARTGTRCIALGGGCFQNRLLLEALALALEQRGLQVLLARRVPPNDGGLALGQAAIYAATEGARGKEPG